MIQMLMQYTHPEFAKLQKTYGDPKFCSILGTGQTNNPRVCFVFMNPTARNVSSAPDWQGIRAPWIGTKSVWRIFKELGFLSEGLYDKSRKTKPDEWTTDFAQAIYENLAEHSIFITNLAKCTLPDARPLPNKLFKKYLPLFDNEISKINPQKIITFGNQVSSVVLRQQISVSKVRKQKFEHKINGIVYPVFPVYYPVGQGMRNIDKAISDLGNILEP